MDDERLTIREMDALDFVEDPANHGTLDVLQIDLYDATARGPMLDTPEFYKACSDCLKPEGVVTVNLFGDHPSYAKNFKAMMYAFDTLICLPEVHDGNVIALAFNAPPKLDLRNCISAPLRSRPRPNCRHAHGLTVSKPGSRNWPAFIPTLIFLSVSPTVG